LATQVTGRPEKLRLLDEREGHVFHSLAAHVDFAFDFGWRSGSPLR
jgi:hypothetical protein